MARGQRFVRSRNGCITCKIRRVKCDEQRPECNRCLSTGRTCDGYWTGSQSLVQQACSLRIIQHVPLHRKPPPAIRLNTDEHRCLEFFQHYTIHGLGAEVGSCLLQATTSEPVIRSVAIAVGSVHLSFTCLSEEDTAFTLRHYNKAIRQLVTSQNSKNTVLLACVLFFCCECLQGRFKTAIQHASSGLRILQQQQLRSHASPERASPAVFSLFNAVQSQVLEIEGMEGMEPETQPKLPPTSDPIPTGPGLNISDHQHIFRQLYHRFTENDALFKAFAETPTDHSPAGIAYEQQLLAEWFRVRGDLKAWMQDFDRQTTYRLQTDPSTASLNAHPIAILKTWKLLFSIYLRMAWPPSELAWDYFTADLQSIVSLVSTVTGDCTARLNTHRTPTVPSSKDTSAPTKPRLAPSPTAPSRPTFTLSLGFLTPLYICATRCRDSTIRHRALRLLATCRRREGVWDSDVAARVARRIIEIEEHAAGVKPGVSYGPADISLAARVRSSSPHFGEGRTASLRYIGGSSRPEVGFMEETIVW